MSSKAVSAGITGADNAAPETPSEVQEEMKFKRVCARCGYNNHTAEGSLSARNSNGKALAGGREAPQTKGATAAAAAAPSDAPVTRRKGKRNSKP